MGPEFLQIIGYAEGVQHVIGHKHSLHPHCRQRISPGGPGKSEYFYAKYKVKDQDGCDQPPLQQSSLTVHSRGLRSFSAPYLAIPYHPSTAA